MTAPHTSTGTTVRAATPADMPHVVKLISARDHQTRDPRVVADYLWNLDHDCTRAWIAYVGGAPVGLTMLYLRHMNWPKSDGAALTNLAGYWAHLYVAPEYRKQMIYPQLVLAMLRGMNAAGLSTIFTATRQPQVAEGHQKLGFALVGKLPLRLRPLRPFQLLAKHKGFAALAPLCAPLDALYGLVRRRPHPHVHIAEVSVDSPQVDRIVELLNDRANTQVHQQWTADQFRRRYRTTLDGTNYRITAVSHGSALVAAVVMTLVERGNRIRAGVLLEVVANSTATRDQIESLLADAEQFARSSSAELMLSLPGSLELEQLAGSLGGYLENRSELYHMLVYPKTMAQPPHLAADLANWIFTFGDHDAF